jgi:Lon protease-like protein
MTTDAVNLEGFTGVARLFPLPNLVLFPGVDQGLHIFEHRYRQMTADALADDGRIALVLLSPNWEHTYDGRPTIEPVACLGEIAASELLDDGRYNLRLRGVARLRIDSELDAPDKLYRLAKCTVLPDRPPADLTEATGWRAELQAVVLGRFDPGGQAHKQLSNLFCSELPLGTVCDQLAYGLPLPVELKQQLLAEPSCSVRAQILAHALRPSARKDRPFPPEFSRN